MPGMSRAIVQVCVSLVAGLCALDATSQSAQTIPPPGPPQPQAAAPVARPAPGFSTPEMRALEEANRISDRDQKLAALRKVQADLKGSVAVFVVREVDEAILWHLITQDDLAERDFREALELSPGLSHAPIALAELELRRGNKAAALDQYLLAAIGGRLKPADDNVFRALYRELKGSDANLERELDKLYDKHFPNPITPKAYEPSGTGSKRVVLLELFTGSACGPCVSADLSWDAVLVRYPEDVIAPLAYHAHIPGPDPMVVPGGDVRRLYYQLTGVPMFNVNGGLARQGGGSREMAVRTYEAAIAAIDRALATKTTADVQVRADRAGSTVNVTARATGLPAGASNLRLHIVLAERHLSYSGENGIRHHAMVVRGVAGSKEPGVPIRGSSDTTVDYVFDLTQIAADVEASLADEIARIRKTRSGAATPPDYRAEGRALSTIDPAALVVVAFVQDASKNVLQAARTSVK